MDIDQTERVSYFESAKDLDNTHSNTPLHSVEDSGYLTGASREIRSPHESRSRIESEYCLTPYITTSTPYFKSIHQLPTKEHIPFNLGSPVKSTPPRYNKKGDNIGEIFIDFLRDLQEYTPPVKKLLSYLEPMDLVNSSYVSKIWYEILKNDKNANRRRLKFVQDKRLAKIEKENKRAFQKISLQDNWLRNPLENIANRNLNSSLPVQNLLTQNTEPLSRHQLFREAGRKLLNTEELRCCPSCRNPSRVSPLNNWGICSKETCGFIYCTKCTLSYHDNVPCPVRCSTSGKANKKSQISSEKSKRNLRRLLD